MKKTLFISLVSFMIVSILGIVALQGYWIYSAWEDKEEEFSLAVQQSLQLAADEIQERELSDYIQAYENLIDSLESPDNASFANIFLFLDEDKPNNLLSYYAYGILEEDYKITPYLDPKLGDTIDIVTDVRQVKNTTIINKNDVFDRENNIAASIEKIKTIERMNVANQRIRNTFKDYTSNTPIHKRLNAQELDFVLKRHFDSKKIITPYEFGIYDDGLATKIKSNNYIEQQQGFRYSTPIFGDQDGIGGYELVVSFPKKEQYVFSSIIGLGGLTLFLTLFIVFVSASALYQIIHQKKLSEIKTDFINNMSHEFKTPIATINLALDAISNPKSILIPEKVERYVKMIREENTRMLTQVENVLRISQLERSSDPLKKAKIDLHSVIEEAVGHIELILADKSGTITKKYNATATTVFGNKSHLTNIIINLLDNAVKYCEKNPKVIVETSSEDSYFILKIRDNGIGMNPNTQKKIFDKFYRATSGNIHNVKGHGLGLAYVKKIIDFHKGEIKLESKVKEGTTFIITLPIIKKNE
ncbi:HAMP domain-containing histidine kinase [Flavobacteriaceae bacterium]|nr:HAMP domain-containing histidine kinase [Flavobacteriaceae bacterium]MDC3354891.1 HAMP domain-containing histidine kinase [Flavobacteriaceae bacterium]